MSKKQINGVTLHVEEHGSGDPILCIHGTGSSSLLWRDAAAALSTRGRTILYDRRGFSRSERPDPFVTNVPQHADDAAALLDALEATPAIVIGRSQGGEIAVDLTLRYPDRVRALALLEGGALGLSEAFVRWEARVTRRAEVAAAVDVAGVAEVVFRSVLGDAGWDGLSEPVKGIFVANGPAILGELRGGVLDVDAGQLRTIRQPALVVAARASQPEFAEATALMAEAIPTARVEWVDGDHLIDPAHPVVLAFVDEVRSRTRLDAVVP